MVRVAVGVGMILAVGLLLFVARSPHTTVYTVSDETAAEMARLRYANSLLQQKVNAYEKDHAKVAVLLQQQQTPCAIESTGSSHAQAMLPPCQSVEDSKVAAEPSSKVASSGCHCEAPVASVSSSPDAPSAGAPDAARDEVDAAHLLAAQRRWDWRSIVLEMLQPWPRIEAAQLDTAVATCNDNGTMYCQRVQIYEGSLYLTDYRAIFFDRHYAPARIMPLLETLRRHPELPNMDLVIAGNDEPRVPSTPGDRYSWTRTCAKWPGGHFGPTTALPPAIFASTVNRAVFDLPWLDFAWCPKMLITPDGP